MPRSKHTTLLATGCILGAAALLAAAWWPGQSGRTGGERGAIALPDAGTRPDGVMPPVLNHGAPLHSPSRVQAMPADDARDELVEKPPADGSQVKKRRQRRTGTAKKKAAEPDSHGVYYTEDGKVDVKKMPPMGG